MFKKILFPTSGSPISEKIATTITKLLDTSNDADITILYVMKVQPMFSAISSQLDDEGVDPSQVALEDAKHVLAKATKVFKENNIPYKIQIEFGEPVETIINVAKESQSELMVVGHHGESTLSDYLFKGDITSQLIGNSICPVLVVK